MRIVEPKSLKHKIAVDRIKNLGGRLTNTKLTAYRELCGASDAEVRAALAWGSDPELSFQRLGYGIDGQNHPVTHKLEINEILVEALDKRLITGAQLDKVAEHELAHWFYRTWTEKNPPLRPNREIGNAYEVAVYGGRKDLLWPDICQKLYGGKCP
jgi:hypothetical protein